MRCLLALLLLCLPLRAATGDITGAEVEDNGWVLKVWVEGMGTNYTFNFGLGTNNSLTGNETVKLALTQPGFEDDGTSNNFATTLVGTKQLRKPYPDDTMDDVTTNTGVGCIIRLALNEYVFAGDGAITGTFLAGFYKDGVATNNAASITVTNSSTQTHPVSIANWSWPGFQNITNNTMTLRMVGYHRSGQNGRPLRAVAADVTDGFTTQTVWQTSMKIDRSIDDACPVQEYIFPVDVSGFTNLSLLRCDWTCYSWRGNSVSALSTKDGVNVKPPKYAPQTNFCNRLGTFGISYAFVATNGVSGGVVTTNLAWNTPFDTIGRALNAVVNSNKVWFGRTNAAGCIVYIDKGNHQWLGTSLSVGDQNPQTWPIIDRWAVSNSITDVNINYGVNYADSYQKYFRISNLLLGFTNSLGIAGVHAALWLDHCIIDSAAGVNGTCTNLYATSCTVSNYGTSGFKRSGIAATLLRGNRIYQETGVPARCFTMLGNAHMKQLGSASVAIVDTIAATVGIPNSDGAICAYNDFRGIKMSASPVAWFAGTNCYTGSAFVNNVIENWDATINQSVFLLASSAHHCTNMIVWNNTIVGSRSLDFYNDTGTNPIYKIITSYKNNSDDIYNIKTDTFTTGSGNRTGNWANVWGVGHYGNVSPNTTNAAASGALQGAEFDGMYSYHAALNLPNWFAWVDIQSASDVSRNGMGNYRIQSSSPAVGRITEWLLPYDLEGNARGKLDPPGAYSSAVPRKGAAFGF